MKSSKEQIFVEASKKVYAKRALIPFFIVTLGVLGFMGYAVSHATTEFVDPGCKPPGCQPGVPVIGSGVSTLLELFKKEVGVSYPNGTVNAGTFTGNTILGGWLSLSTLCFSDGCKSSWASLGGGSFWGLNTDIPVNTRLENISGKPIDAKGQQVKNLALPTQDFDAVRKKEYDDLAAFVGYVPPVPPIPGSTTLHVIKQLVNDNGGTATVSSFNLHVKLSGVDVTGSPHAGAIAPGTQYSLSAGTYMVSEDANASYTQSFSGDCNSSGSVTLVVGDNKTCTVTNNDIVPPLIPPPAGNITSTVTATGILTPHAVVTPSDGRPIMVYDTLFGSSSGSLDYRRCANSACSSSSVLSIDSYSGAGSVPSIAGMALGTDGFPVIAYMPYGYNSRIKIIKCKNIDCTITEKYQYLYLSYNRSLTGIAVAVGADSFPAIAVTVGDQSGGPSNDIYVFRCTTTTCSSIFAGASTRITTTAPALLATAGISVTPDGRPLIAWREGANLKVIHCTNTVCNGSNTIATVTVDATAPQPSGFGFSGHPAMTLSSDGRALLSYVTNIPGNANGSNLKYLRCGNDLCTTGNTTKVIDSDPAGEGDYISMTLQNGVPVIAYQSTFTRDLLYARCSDFDCASVSRTGMAMGDNYDGNFVAISTGTDGFPFMVHGEKITPGNVLQDIYIKCNSTTCQ